MALNGNLNGAESSNQTMSRAFRRKKRSFNNSAEQNNADTTMDKNPFLQSTFLKWERILGKVPHRNSYSFAEYRRRLAGGADNEANNINKSVSQIETDISMANETAIPLSMPQRYESKASSHRHSRAISEKKVDEIIDCAIQNLQEAGKALVSLGENHEHEIKMMVMDLLAKFQKWIDVVQKKLDAAKKDMNSIRRAYAAQVTMIAVKDRELVDLQTKLTEYETAQAAAEKKINEYQSKAVECDLPNYTEAPNMPARISTVQSEIINEALKNIPSEIIVHHASHTNQPLSSSSGRTLSRPTISFSDTPVKPILSQIIRNTIGDNVVSRTASLSAAASLPKTSRSSIKVSGAGSNIMIVPSPPSNEIPDNLLLDSVSVPQQTDLVKMVSIEARTSDIPLEPNVPPLPVISSGIMNNEEESPIITTSAPILKIPEVQLKQKKNQDKEQNGRVTELEAELIQLRIENEKMKRDHTEYENDIQRALLQGVSSLNAEALKVLRNSPFICYKPCEPCNNPSQSASATISNKPFVAQVQKDRASQHDGTNSSKVGISHKNKENGAHSSLRRQATSVCYAPVKKSSQNSMLLLLPQQHIDCTCASTVEEYYVAANRGRAARTFPRERVYCTSRVTAGRDGFHGGHMRTYARAFERCEPPCHRSRRFNIN